MRDQFTLDNIKWAAKLEHVREVSLFGTADLEFWTRYLERWGLLPAEEDGLAQVVLVAADSRFMGVPFRELSVSVNVQSSHNNRQLDAACLVQAFNSSRFFAFCERTFFGTPYRHANVRVSTERPAFVRLAINSDVLVEARLNVGASNENRSPGSIGPKTWQAAIHLPPNSARRERKQKYFITRIDGETRKYGFDMSQDSLTIASDSGVEVLQLLRDSQFAPVRWEIRPDAAHAKSKTYAQQVLPATRPS